MRQHLVALTVTVLLGLIAVVAFFLIISARPKPPAPVAAGAKTEQPASTSTPSR